MFSHTKVTGWIPESYKPATLGSSSSQHGRDPECRRGDGGGGGRKRMDALPPILFAARHEKKWATVNANAEKNRHFGCGCVAKTGGRQWF